MSYRVVDIPERRLTVNTSGTSEVGRIWTKPSRAFAKLQGSFRVHWLPRATGDDYETQAGVQVGKTLGQIPFDELFMLGVERDNHLWLRGIAELAMVVKVMLPWAATIFSLIGKWTKRSIAAG